MTEDLDFRLAKIENRLELCLAEIHKVVEALQRHAQFYGFLRDDKSPFRDVP